MEVIVSCQPPSNDNPQNPEQPGNYEQTAYPQLYGGASSQSPYDPSPQVPYAPYGDVPSQSPYQPFQQSPYASPPPQPAYAPATPYPLYGVSTVQQERGRGSALAGLVLGIIGLLAEVAAVLVTSLPALFALFWLGGLAISIVGIILSAFGCRSKSRKTMAMVGLVLSIIVLVIGLFFALLGVIYASQHP